MFRLKLLLLKLGKALWVKASLFALLAIASALAAVALKPLIPDDFPELIGANAVGSILNIIASSMLAVTTFSLSTMVAAYGSTSNVTPRATSLIREDTTTHNVLSTFIGSFIFSLAGIISLNIGFYDDQSRTVLFLATLLVVVLIIVTLIRWIEHLTKLGRLNDTTELVENVTLKSLLARAKYESLGGRILDDPEGQIPKHASAISSDQIGYIQYIDVDKLACIAREADCDIYVSSLPGTFVGPASPLLWLTVPASQTVRNSIISCFVIGDNRSFEQDPRFGLCTMAEIASKALSQAINDHGTPIDVIGRGVRIMYRYADAKQDNEIVYPRLWIPPLPVSDLFSDFFAPVARDAGAVLEVHIRLQKAFRMLNMIDDDEFKKCSRHYSQIAYKIAGKSAMLKEDLDCLEQLLVE